MKRTLWNAGLRPAIISLLLFLILSPFIEALPEEWSQALSNGWQIQSSADMNVPGEKISSKTFNTKGWHEASVPSTVLGTLAANGVYRDLYFGRNLETVSPEPFRSSWWYRKEFDLSGARAETVRLVFDGINFRANVFVNGTQVGSADSVMGSFRRFQFDVSRLLRKKGNVLAVEVFPPKPGDFTIGFVDWNPTPADRNMGLFREVHLRATGPVTIEDPFVQTKLDLQSFKGAEIIVSATISNHSNVPVSGKIAGKIEGIPDFQERYSLGAKESKQIQFSKVVIQNPRVWWPNNQGTPELYNLKLTASDGRGPSDVRSVTFGIREFGDYINEQGHRGYLVNGRKILIRGGGWVDDLLLRENAKNLEDQFKYAKHLNLNLIRLEGFWGSSHKLYELADRYGILLMAGFSCQWEWEDYLGKPVDENFGGVIAPEDQDLVVSYLQDQVLWLRNHPSILVWAVASDKLPPPALEKRFREELAKIDPTRPILASTKGYTSEISGPTAVKMNGPYEYETPNYWYIDKENGGAFGFDTEVSPGAQPPPAESIQKMFAKEHYWPMDDAWNFHSGRNEFRTMERYLNAFNKRYGPAETLDDFASRAQAMNYEAIRAMFEAFGVRKPVSTGVIQWMLNAAWPKMFWQLYDYYMVGGGAFYAARKANQPLNIAYDYGTRTIHVVNDTHQEHPALQAEVKIFSVASKELFSQSFKTSIGKNESRKVAEIPIKEDLVFLSLKLKDGNGASVAENFYWLTEESDELDFKATEWFYTPITEFADLTPLNELPPAKVQIDQQLGTNEVTVTLKNIDTKIAFFIELKVVGDKTGRSIVPIFWNDNYISLLPGETKQLTARFSPDDLRGEKPLLQYSGWNVVW